MFEMLGFIFLVGIAIVSFILFGLLIWLIIKLIKDMKEEE